MAGVFLVGFMGSGKTSVGRCLAERLKRSFIDLDERIEAAAGRPIAAIFAGEGEACFRDLETQALESLGEGSDVVVALGGGAFALPRNREILDRMGGITVFLECPVELLIERCAGLDHRPLFRDPEAFAELYRQRLPDYRKAAFTVNSGLGTPEEVAESIARRCLGVL